MNKSYTLMELEAIKKLCKSVNLIASLPADLIADTNVATNTTYSSYKIDAEMSALENDIQRYVDTALAGLNKLTKEVIDDKALVVKENVLYLYKDPTDMNNDYMQMMLINGVAVELGSTTCDFSSVYSKDEANDKFALKINLDTLTTSFNNLVTSVENKIDKDKIVTVLDDTVTDDEVASARLVYEELDKKVEELKANFEVGVNTIYNSVVAKGVTPIDKSPSSIADAISKICIIKENIPLIPIMTSDTTPSGKVSTSSNANSSVSPYYSFDGTDKYWASKTSTHSWIRYDFDEDVCVNKISFKVVSENAGTNMPRVKDFRFETSINGYDWVTLYTGTVAKDCTNTQTFEFDNKNFYKYYRVYIVDGYSGTVYNALNYLQFYGYKYL